MRGGRRSRGDSRMAPVGDSLPARLSPAGRDGPAHRRRSAPSSHSPLVPSTLPCRAMSVAQSSARSASGGSFSIVPGPPGVIRRFGGQLGATQPHLDVGWQGLLRSSRRPRCPVGVCGTSGGDDGERAIGLVAPHEGYLTPSTDRSHEVISVPRRTPYGERPSLWSYKQQVRAQQITHFHD